MRRLALTTLIFGSALLIACGGEDLDPPNNNDTVPQSYSVSECGGFAVNQRSSAGYSGNYCDAERLDWTFDASSATLKLTDKRVLLNCCGDHSVTVAKQGAGYLITEIDAPEQQGGRCLCMCVFDFAVTIKQVQAGLVPIEIRRDTTDDSAAPKTVFKGTLDLSKSAGSELISSKSVDPWCN